METRTLDHTIPRNTVLHGNCIPLMQAMPAETVDFILTDPPYLIGYHDRLGRQVANAETCQFSQTPHPIVLQTRWDRP
jgi:site-specific DNA-methyltransferase (adenine-specific)